MADYLALAAFVVIINVIPAFMPPTWTILALAKINDPAFDPILLTFIGATSSTAGRAILSAYSGFFRRFFSKELMEHAKDIQQFFAKKDRELFFGTFIYSLSPFPSNLIFIANGLTKVNSTPIFGGFFIGRIVSYFTLIVISQSAVTSLGDITQNEQMIRIAFDVIGILAAFSVVLVDWKKIMQKLKK
ncbi:hypothetical protein HY990_05215 [Candidatus Micrarchaeota archaeon]|nr:hypothetical protein [Candidatus Micrarchaeota archaeon]